MPRYFQKIVLKRTVIITGHWIREINRIFDAADDTEADITGQTWYDDFIENAPDGFEYHVKECSLVCIPDNPQTWFAFSGTGVMQLQRKLDG